MGLFGTHTIITEHKYIHKSWVNQANVGYWERERDNVQRGLADRQKSREERMQGLREMYQLQLQTNAKDAKLLETMMLQQIGDLMAENQKDVNKTQAELEELEQGFREYIEKLENEYRRREIEANLEKSQKEVEWAAQQLEGRALAAKRTEAEAESQKKTAEALKRLEDEQMQELKNKREAARLEAERIEQLNTRMLEQLRRKIQTERDEILRQQAQVKLDIETQEATEKAMIEQHRQTMVGITQQQVEVSEKTANSSVQSLKEPTVVRKRFIELGLDLPQAQALTDLYCDSNKKLRQAVEALHAEIKSGERPLSFQKHPGCSEVCPLIAFLQGGANKTSPNLRVGDCEAAHEVAYQFQMDYSDPSKMKVVSFAPHVANN